MPPEEIAPRRRAWALAALLVIAGAGASAYAAFGTNRQESPTRAPDAPPSTTATPTPDAEIATLLTKARAMQADDPAGAYDIVTKVRDRFPGDADAKAAVAEIEPMLRKAALAAVRVTTPGTSAISNRRTIELSGSVDSADRIRTLRAALVPGRSATGPLPTNAVDVPVSSARTFATTLTAPGDGEWSLRVQASDGRIAADLEPRIVRVDATPPTVTLREPASDRLLANITAVVDVEDVGQVMAVTVNGVTVERDGAGRWSCSLSLDANVRELVVVARDDAANETRFVKRVRVVTDPPAVHVTKDLPRFTREREVVLEGRVDDPTTTSVSWAGAPITVAADGRFRATATFRAEGEQTFHLVAKDVAGPEASREVIACYDITSPVLTWTSPTADSVAVGQVLLTGTVRDDHAVTVRVNGADATVRGGTWTASVEVTDAGLDVVVSASDEAGNVTTLATRRLSARALAADITWGTREPDATDVLVDGRLHPSVVRVRGTSIRMHLVPGCPDGFTMGSPLTEPDREEDEQQQQRIVRPFWIAETEVTNEQWKAVTGNDASGATMPEHPVVGVTFRECLDFLARLSERAGTAERPLRLPNEAEWEYACRAGSAAPFSIDPARICAKAEAPVAAGSTPANAFGLHEMHGNVWEWCADPFSSDRETSGAASPSSQARVVRGGSWRTERSRCRSANRNLNWSYDRANDLGFRIARNL